MVYKVLGKSAIRGETIWGSYATLAEARKVLERKKSVYGGFGNLNYKFRIKKSK